MASYEAKKKITAIATKESAPSPPVDVSPKKRKSGKSKDNEQSSPSKKSRSKRDSTNDDLEILNEMISKSMEKAMTTVLASQEERFSALTHDLEHRLNLRQLVPPPPPTPTSSSRPQSRASSRSNLHSRASSRYEDNIFHPIPTRPTPFLEPPPVNPTMNFAQPSPPFRMANPTPFQGNILTPTSALRYWPWVEQTHVAAIASGTFEFDHLPKLLRSESARRKHLEQTVNSLVMDIESGKQKVVLKDSKLGTVFPNFQAFASAFLIYTTIRCLYEKDYGGPLSAWLEYIAHCAYRAPWSNVLEYAREYFKNYQALPPESWYVPDHFLLGAHFTFNNSNPPHPPNSNSQFNAGSSNPPKNRTHRESTKDSRTNTGTRSTVKEMPYHLQCCLKYNKGRCDSEKPCGRMHICYSCSQSGHPCSQCPTKPMTLKDD